jgi:hypothetical protein
MRDLFAGAAGEGDHAGGGGHVGFDVGRGGVLQPAVRRAELERRRELPRRRLHVLNADHAGLVQAALAVQRRD